jgi:hypothetical protein
MREHKMVEREAVPAVAEAVAEQVVMVLLELLVVMVRRVVLVK